MHAQCVTVRDPFHPWKDRVTTAVPAGRPIGDIVPATDQPFIILRNGDAVLRADWQQPVSDGDLLAVVMLPQGGGGGSNPLKVVLMIAVAAVAGPIAQSLAWGVASSTSISVAGFNALAAGFQVGIGLVGASLVNALIPTPKLPTPQQAQSLASPSPTYNLSAQGNTARLDSAIPVQYGRCIAFPDFAAQPYTEYAGNEQYLYQLLCIGQGEYDVEAVLIEDTQTTSFDEIEYEIVGPSDSVTLFPTNVVTSPEVSGQELIKSSYVGPFTLNSASTEINAIAYDVVMPRGLYEVNGDGSLSSMSISFKFEAREIDNNGDPVGAGTWSVLGTETITGRTTTPQRRSYRYTVSLGRYEVRATRTDTKETGTTFGHEGIWASARGYMPDTRNFGNVTLIAMRMKASNNLSQRASRRINVISTRKLPIWNGSTWSSNTATTSIAWALADACRNGVYGAALADARIDLDALLELDAVWSARMDQFNGRFDSALSFWEALGKIATAGRAKPYLQGGIVRFVRDQAETTPVALYSMRNIVRGSFSIEYVLPSDETADAIDVGYWDENYWSPRRVQAKLPGSTAAKPAKVELFGVTKRQQAFREGMYHAANNVYRRRVIKFATEMEGFIPAVGDLIAVQHDMPAWGQFAEAVEYDSDSMTLTVSEPLTWDSGDHYIALRKKDGSIDGPYLVTAGATDYEVVFGDSLTETPYTGRDYERTQITFGVAETWRQEARVLMVRPRGLYEVEIECINEDPSVHTADQGVVAPPVKTSQLTTIYTRPLIANLVMHPSLDDNTQSLMTWTPAPGAEVYQIEMAFGTNPEDTELVWTRAGDTTANHYSVTAIYGARTLIRIRGVSALAVGPWYALLYADQVNYMWVDPDALMWDADDTTLMWSY